ncbi:MAG: acyltransferase [Halioglobus sp.]|nr:acyltransferase [Halioglobus sp.]
MKYRPEIDGLRTIAVASVILYHAKITLGDFTLLPGGYLGVDIFFVISGYLITTLLISELTQSGRISFLNFYERRARRLLPAMLVVMLASLPFAWHYLLPNQLVDFSKSLMASLFFSSNFYWDFSLQQYEAESALLQPFLHTWSLAVEEQYYIIFPLLLFAIYRWNQKYLVSILGVGLLSSLFLAQWMTGQDGSFSFYMLPTRFWELLAGSLLALYLLDRSTPHLSSRLITLAPALGMLMVTGSLLGVGFEAHHPGVITLIPVLGTVLIIGFKTEGDWVNATLSRPSMVYLGLLSYSLYLWHYPIFAFGRMADANPSLAHKGSWIVFTLALSALTYHLIERPFRSRRLTTRTLAISLLTTSSLVIVVSMYWIQSDGIPERHDYVGDLLNASQTAALSQDKTLCHSGGRDPAGGRGPIYPISNACVFEDFPGAATLVLVGDSHAGVLAGSVRDLARENQLNFAQITQVGCPHLEGNLSALCRERTESIRPFLRKFEKATIIYSARLPLYIEWEPFDNEEGSREPENSNMTRASKTKGTARQRANQVISTLSSWINDGHELVIIYPVPEQGFHVSVALNLISSGIESAEDLPVLSTSYAVFKKRVASSYKALDQISGPRVKRVYPEKLFCTEASGRCFASEHDRIYFLTDNHPSQLGSDLIVKQVADMLHLKMPDSFQE